MPNRYLRGTGARNWNDTANWSDTSGGAGGASVPTAADNVIFDANSGTGTITVNAIANMLDFTCTNIGALTIANAAYAFNVYGSLTLHTNLTVTFTSTGYLYMKATDSRTITTNGKVVNWNRLYFDGLGGTWTNQDDMNVTSLIYLSNGHWNTNSKNILNMNAGFGTVAGVKTLTLGSSLFYVYSFSNSNPSNFTFNYDTSTVRIFGDASIYANTFYNLELLGRNDGRESAGNGYLLGNTTVNNTLTISGINNTVKRILIASNSIGTPRTITCNGTVTASNVDFRDITLAGTCNKDLSTISGGSGDCGGNSGIVFTTAQPQYFKKYASTANVGDAANWFSDLALSVAGRVPLPQDLGSKYIAGSFDRTCTVTCNVPRIPCLDMSEVVNTVTWTLANAVEVYGSYVLGANITQSGNYILTLMGRGNYLINTFQKLIYRLVINAYLGNYLNLSDVDVALYFLITLGTFDFNEYNLTAYSLYCQGGLTYCRHGIFTLKARDPGSADALNVYSSVIISANLATFIFYPQSGSLNSRIVCNSGAIAFKVIKLLNGGTHTGNFDILSSNTITELIIDSGRKVMFTAGTTQTIGKATIGAGATISSVTAATHTLNYTGDDVVEADGGITVTNSIATPSEKWYAGDGSTDGGGNSGWLFETAFTPKIIWID